MTVEVWRTPGVVHRAGGITVACLFAGQVAGTPIVSLIGFRDLAGVDQDWLDLMSGPRERRMSARLVLADGSVVELRGGAAGSERQFSYDGSGPYPVRDVLKVEVALPAIGVLISVP